MADFLANRSMGSPLPSREAWLSKLRVAGSIPGRSFFFFFVHALHEWACLFGRPLPSITNLAIIALSGNFFLLSLI